MDLLAERTLQGGFGGLAISFAGWIDADGRGISAGPNIGWGAEALTDYAAAHGLRCHLGKRPRRALGVNGKPSARKRSAKAT